MPSYLRRTNLCDEPVTPGRYRCHEARRVGIVAQGPPNFSYRSVDTGLAIDEHALAPDALENFLARDELSASLDEQAQQFERNPLERYDHIAAA